MPSNELSDANSTRQIDVAELHTAFGQETKSGSRPLRVESQKLCSCYIDMFQITHCMNPVTYRLDLHRSLQVHPTINLSHLRPFNHGPLNPLDQPPP